MATVPADYRQQDSTLPPSEHLCLPRSGSGNCLENGLAHLGCPTLPNSSLQLLELVEERMVGLRGLPCGPPAPHTHRANLSHG